MQKSAHNYYFSSYLLLPSNTNEENYLTRWGAARFWLIIWHHLISWCLILRLFSWHSHNSRQWFLHGSIPANNTLSVDLKTSVVTSIPSCNKYHNVNCISTKKIYLENSWRKNTKKHIFFLKILSLMLCTVFKNHSKSINLRQLANVKMRQYFWLFSNTVSHIALIKKVTFILTLYEGQKYEEGK